MFAAPWPPGSDPFSWFVEVTVLDGSGSHVFSYVSELHDGVRSMYLLPDGTPGAVDEVVLDDGSLLLWLPQVW